MTACLLLFSKGVFGCLLTGVFHHLFAFLFPMSGPSLQTGSGGEWVVLEREVWSGLPEEVADPR